MPQKLVMGQGRTIFVNSGSVSASSATPSLKSAPTLYATVPACDAVDLYLDVTANSGTPGSASWVQLETSPDGGTTWMPVIRFAQITTSATLQKVSMRTNGIGGNEAAAATNGSLRTATAQVATNCILAADQRVVWTIGTGMSVTFGLYAIVQPTGTRVGY